MGLCWFPGRTSVWIQIPINLLSSWKRGELFPNLAGFQDHTINKYTKQNGQTVYVDVTFGSNEYTDFETYLNENTYILCENGQRFDANATYPNGITYLSLFFIKDIN